MIKATSIKQDTTPLPKRYTDSKRRNKKCLETLFNVVLFIYLPLDENCPHWITKKKKTPRKNNLALARLHSRTQWSVAWDQHSFSYITPPPSLWRKPLLLLLGSRQKRDVNWTRSCKVTFYVLSTPMWYLDCECCKMGRGPTEGGLVGKEGVAVESDVACDTLLSNFLSLWA